MGRHCPSLHGSRRGRVCSGEAGELWAHERIWNYLGDKARSQGTWFSALQESDPPRYQTWVVVSALLLFHGASEMLWPKCTQQQTQIPFLCSWRGSQKEGQLLRTLAVRREAEDRKPIQGLWPRVSWVRAASVLVLWFKNSAELRVYLSGRFPA